MEISPRELASYERAHAAKSLGGAPAARELLPIAFFLPLIPRLVRHAARPTSRFTHDVILTTRVVVRMARRENSPRALSLAPRLG